ncbi:hypothetical protein BSPLISOX_449 [uncultured Gammaproteobacteria bacterium]|nr:hypothetical protein [uncultured Gammaproteobacteria bacterium]VVH64133.1 hypothetical protein BSPLISOX_449 [uncultured Gammaproteobacteria bacterium]
MTQHSTLSNNFLIRMHHGKEALRAKIISNRGRNIKKGQGFLLKPKHLRFEFIAIEAINYPITVLCRCMQVSKSGYYYCKTTPQSPRSRQNDKIILQIIHAFKHSRKTYGSPRIYHQLKA